MILPDKIIYSNRRSISLEITEDGTFLVRAPKHARQDDISAFVLSKQSWIVAKMSHSKSQTSIAREVTGAEYSCLPFLGKELMVLYHSRHVVQFDSFFLYLPHPKIRNNEIKFHDTTLTSELIEQKNKALIVSWYRDIAHTILQERTDYYASLMGLSCSGIRITKARTNWGSCNKDGGINYSWHLITVSLAEIDYVIIHELAHIRHRDHSHTFYHEIQLILPDYKERIAALRRHQWVLEIFPD